MSYTHPNTHEKTNESISRKVHHGLTNRSTVSCRKILCHNPPNTHTIVIKVNLSDFEKILIGGVFQFKKFSQGSRAKSFLKYSILRKVHHGLTNRSTIVIKVNLSDFEKILRGRDIPYKGGRGFKCLAVMTNVVHHNENFPRNDFHSYLLYL